MVRRRCDELSRLGVILPLVKHNAHRRGSSKVDAGRHRDLVRLLVEQEGAEALERRLALDAHTHRARGLVLDVGDGVAPVALHHEDLLLAGRRGEGYGELGAEHWDIDVSASFG